jgi:hypothetical protein
MARALPVALAACASGPQAPMPAANVDASAAHADKPKVKVGDRWTFACAGLGERAWVVTAVDANAIKGTENGKPLLLTPELNQLESPRAQTSDRKCLNFPLQVGKAWTSECQWVRAGFSGSESATVSVVSFEKHNVRAGAFDTFKISFKSSWASNMGRGGSNVATFWYAPAARAIVKEDLMSTGISTEHCELASYTLQP